MKVINVLMSPTVEDTRRILKMIFCCRYTIFTWLSPWAAYSDIYGGWWIVGLYKDGVVVMASIGESSFGYRCGFVLIGRIKNSIVGIDRLPHSLVCFGKLLDLENQMARLHSDFIRTESMVSQNTIRVQFGALVRNV